MKKKVKGCLLICLVPLLLLTAMVVWSNINDGWRATDVSIPTPIEVNQRPVAAGGSNFIIMENGDLWAWGFNQWGADSWEARFTPKKIWEDVAFACAQWRHFLLISSDGTLFARGQNDFGQIGDGTLGGGQALPIPIMENVTAVSAGINHSTAITQDGTLWVWGDNEANWRGDAWLSPVSIMDNVVAVSASTSSRTLVVSSDNTLLNINIRSERRPTEIMDDVIAVAPGGRSLAITSDGVLWAWGVNNHGQIGDGTRQNRDTPVRIMDDVVAVSASSNNSMAITSDGSLWVWGDNGNGQIGDGTKRNRISPVLIMENVVYAHSGESHSIAITADGNVWAWGNNEFGQLGDGTTIDRHYPVKIMDNILLP